MSYTERVHPHQSESLDFLSPSYIPYRIDKKGRATFGVIKFVNRNWRIAYQHRIPAYGGYLSREENIYGSPTYCPNGTKHHLRHLKIYGSMPHLVFFDSEETAKKAGFRKCKVCTN